MAISLAVYGLYSSVIPSVTEKVSMILPALAKDIGIRMVPPMPIRPFLAKLLIAILIAYPALANSLILLSSSPSYPPNMAYMRFSYRVRANG
jgi:hypothetical protein